MLAKLSVGPENSSTLQKLSSLESACGTASGINSCLDTLALVSLCATGAMFYEVDSASGNFKIGVKSVKNENGETVLVPCRILKSPLSIASKVTRLASKATSCVCFAGGNLNLMNLGKHAKGLGGVSTSLSAISSACGAADDVLSIIDNVRSGNNEGETSCEAIEERRQTLREKILSLVCNAIDLVSDILGLLFSFAPALLGPHALLVIGIFWLISSVLNFVQGFIG
ncbi:hypothetical protein [Chlamydia felis]